MTSHSHPEYVPGCFRCDLSRDEVTATDRPSVTDNARAEAWAEGYDAGASGELLPEENPYRAAARAETTTATTEEAWEVIARVRDAYPRANNDAPTDEIVEALADAGLLFTEAQRMQVEGAAQVLRDREHLLATARTRPTETTTEWGRRAEGYQDWIADPKYVDDPKAAAEESARLTGGTVIRREVTPWTEADQ